MSDRTVLKLGGLAGIVGGLGAIVLNAVHPRISDYEDPIRATLEEVAGYEAWTGIHLGLMLSIVLILLGLFVFARTIIDSGRSAILGRLALGALVVSGGVALLALPIDTYALRETALNWAQDGHRDIPFAVASAVTHVSWATFMAISISLLGVVPVAFGAAVAQGGDYPKVLGWPVAYLGLGSISAGAWGLVGGPTKGFFVLFGVTSFLLSAWVVVAGWLLWRRAAAPPRKRAATRKKTGARKAPGARSKATARA